MFLSFTSCLVQFICYRCKYLHKNIFLYFIFMWLRAWPKRSYYGYKSLHLRFSTGMLLFYVFSLRGWNYNNTSEKVMKRAHLEVNSWEIHSSQFWKWNLIMRQKSSLGSADGVWEDWTHKEESGSSRDCLKISLALDSRALVFVW